jgi:hypothetical protein
MATKSLGLFWWTRRRAETVPGRIPSRAWTLTRHYPLQVMKPIKFLFKFVFKSLFKVLKLAILSSIIATVAQYFKEKKSANPVSFQEWPTVPENPNQAE